MGPPLLHIRLPRDPSAPRTARDFVRKHYPELGEALPKLELVVTELVTNALVHGQGRIELRLRKQDEGVRGEVTDEGGGFEAELHEMPDLMLEPDQRAGGLGLPLVASLCDRWGVYEGSSHIWFELRPVSDFSEPTPPRLGRDAAEPPQAG